MIFSICPSKQIHPQLCVWRLLSGSLKIPLTPLLAYSGAMMVRSGTTCGSTTSSASTISREPAEGARDPNIEFLHHCYEFERFPYLQPSFSGSVEDAVQVGAPSPPRHHVGIDSADGQHARRHLWNHGDPATGGNTALGCRADQLTDSDARVKGHGGLDCSEVRMRLFGWLSIEMVRICQNADSR